MIRENAAELPEYSVLFEAKPSPEGADQDSHGSAITPTTLTQSEAISAQPERFSALRRLREQALNVRIGRIALEALTVVGAMTGATVTNTQDAYAATAIVQVQDTGADGLWVHDGGPGLNTTLAKVIPNGSSVEAD